MERPSEASRDRHRAGWRARFRPRSRLVGAKGRLSNPVPRRLSAGDISDLCHLCHLCHLYSDGNSIDSLARQYEVNRTTIITHLDQAGIERRRVARKMTDDSVATAATRYGRRFARRRSEGVRYSRQDSGPRVPPSGRVDPVPARPLEMGRIVLLGTCRLHTSSVT